MIGAAEGTGEIALNIARDTVLNAATFGGYGVYKLGEALWNGYKEDGVLGAANSVNPLFHFVIAGIDTTLAAIAANRDYRALGAGGVKTLALGAAAVVAIAYGVGAVVESAGLRGVAAGGTNTVTGTSTLSPGPYARQSIPARGPGRDFTRTERDTIDEIGRLSGCHTCGTTSPGTRSGHFIPDHQPPSQLAAPSQPQVLYPHCKTCSVKQGGDVTGQLYRK
jgi:hypothetical protein